MTSYSSVLLPAPAVVLGSTCSSHLPLQSRPGPPSPLDNPHDNRILYPIIKVLYALHTLLERIAASKTLQSERGWGRVMNKEVEKGRHKREGGGKTKGGKGEEGKEGEGVWRAGDGEIGGGIQEETERDRRTERWRENCVYQQLPRTTKVYNITDICECSWVS